MNNRRDVSIKAAAVLAACVSAFAFASCGTIPYSALEGLDERVFYLDTFETQTLGNVFFLMFSEEDTKSLQDHYARTARVDLIKTALEEKFGIVVDISEFESARSAGPITRDAGSSYDAAYGMKYSRWNSSGSKRHSNSIIISYSPMEVEVVGRSGFRPACWGYVYLLIGGKYVQLTHENGSSYSGIEAREIGDIPDMERWMDFYRECIGPLHDTLIYCIRHVQS